MADKVKVKLLRPLNNGEIGSTVEYERADAYRLVAYGAVEIVGGVKAERAPANKMVDAPANKAADITIASRKAKK